MINLSNASFKILPLVKLCIKNSLSPKFYQQIKFYRAAMLNEFGKPLQIAAVQENRKIGDNKVLINVSYCSLNSSDVKLLKGGYKKMNVELPIIPGYEFSGEVVETGSKVKTKYPAGTRVVALKNHLDAGGGLAGEALVNETDVWPCGVVSLKDAAVLPYGHGTALLALSKYCEINENDWIIVTAGPAGLGLGAIEVAASVFKAKVIAICDTEDSSALLREEGAFQSICIKEGLGKVTKYLEKALNGKKAKVGIDAIGNGLLYILDEFIDPLTGTLISIDPFYSKEKLVEDKSKVDLKLGKSKTKRTPIETRVKHVSLEKYRETDIEFYRSIVSETLTLCEEEIISAYVSSTFQLDDIEKAIKFIEEKKCTGKVLIEIREKQKQKEKEQSDKEVVRQVFKSFEDKKKQEELNDEKKKEVKSKKVLEKKN